MGARVLVSCFLVSAWLCGVAARGQAAAPEPAGSVSGHVYCADTNRPARLARVTIEPVDDLNAITVDARGNILPRRVPTTTIAETGTDGGYLIENVAPGQYYIVAELPGYVSPVAEFTTEDFQLPTANAERRFRERLERVTVFRGQTARMDFRLERGAAIEGKVLYDDGSAVPGAAIFVLRRDEKLGWVPVSDIALDRFQNAPTTDDRGRYRVAMLVPGEYTVAVNIQRVTMTTSGGTPFGGQMVPRGQPGGTLVYFGNMISRAHAKSVTLNRGDEYSGADITVPMRKLYTVSGTVVAQDGHPIDSAHVSLVDAADGSSVKDAGVSVGSGRFTMMFVPEGRYLVKVTDAAYGVIETGPIEGGQGTYSRFVPRHIYGDTELSLQVGGDVWGFMLKVPEPAPLH